MQRDEEHGFRVTLRGWPAVAVIGLVLAIGVGHRLYLRQQLSVDPQARAAIQSALTAQLYRDLTDNGQALKKAGAAGDRAALEAMGSRITGARIEIRQLAMRGGSDENVVRVTYTVHVPGQAATTQVRHYLCSHSLLTGWVCKYEVPVWRWYFELF